MNETCIVRYGDKVDFGVFRVTKSEYCRKHKLFNYGCLLERFNTRLPNIRTNDYNLVIGIIVNDKDLYFIGTKVDIDTENGSYQYSKNSIILNNRGTAPNQYYYYSSLDAAKEYLESESVRIHRYIRFMVDDLQYRYRDADRNMQSYMRNDGNGVYDQDKYEKYEDECKKIKAVNPIDTIKECYPENSLACAIINAYCYNIRWNYNSLELTTNNFLDDILYISEI